MNIRFGRDITEATAYVWEDKELLRVAAPPCLPDRDGGLV